VTQAGPDYDSMQKQPLIDLCTERGLPTGGTAKELAARLRGYDAAHQIDGDDLLDLAQTPPAPPELVVAEPDEPTPAQTPRAVPASSANGAEPGQVNDHVFTQYFECEGALPTELHTEYIARTARAAHQAGVRVRGGAYRNGFVNRGGKRYAQYEITLARR